MSAKSPERQEFLNDVLTTAVEGGIGYWSQVSEYRWDGVEVAYVVVHDTEEGDDAPPIRVTANDLAGAIRKILDPGSTISLNASYVSTIALANRTNDAGELDADDADIIFQVAALGDVIYG